MQLVKSEGCHFLQIETVIHVMVTSELLGLSLSLVYYMILGKPLKLCVTQFSLCKMGVVKRPYS